MKCVIWYVGNLEINQPFIRGKADKMKNPLLLLPGQNTHGWTVSFLVRNSFEYKAHMHVIDTSSLTHRHLRH